MAYKEDNRDLAKLEGFLHIGMLGLSLPSTLSRTVQNAIPLTTNILVVGGAYAGLATIRSLADHFRERQKQPNAAYTQKMAPILDSRRKLTITLVEPRAGLLNIIGIPKAAVDSKFAPSQFVPWLDLENLAFDKIVSNDPRVEPSSSKNNDDFEVNFVHGKVTYLDERKAQYVLNNSSEKAIIDFDYVVYAAGRNRGWPVTPDAHNMEVYLEEMARSEAQIAENSVISVIGAGAVGVELAGDIKHRFPNKTVNLIHPHLSFPPEPLSDAFKDLTHKSLEGAGVNVITNTRVDREETNGNLITTDGRTIPSQLNHWCTFHKNNIEVLSSRLRSGFVSPKGNVYVNEYLQLQAPETSECVSNFFCVGDLVEKPIIKSAGWAMYMGRQTANNLVSLVFDERLVEPFPDLCQMPKGMVIIAGNGEVISELSGEVELNHLGYVEEYRDYCMGKVRATLGM